jgi:flagellin-like hook-associated protein FlgL
MAGSMSDISLTTGMRRNLVSLQDTLGLLNRTQDRLASGKRVMTSVDDPVNYFAAQQHLSRAGDLALRKDGMAEGINTATAASKAIDAILGMVEQAKGIANSALATQDTLSRAQYATQFDTIMSQIVSLASDAGYKGSNLLASTTTLTVKFNEAGTAKLDIAGFEARTVANLSMSFAAQVSNWATTANAVMETTLTHITTATENLRTQAKSLSGSLNVITSRQDFTKGMIDTLKAGADNLTLADMNEESANMLMLQTRQSLGITSLSLASQAAQSIMRLF